MISSPKGIEPLGALDCMVFISTSVFEGVGVSFPVMADVDRELCPKGLLLWVSEGGVLEDMTRRVS